MEHILSGYKVLGFTHFLAGPTSTRIMAEMGTDVIKVEAISQWRRSASIAVYEGWPQCLLRTAERG